MKIIQLLMTPNDSAWQGVLLGLGDNGVTYHCQTGTWKPYIPPIDQKADDTCKRCGGLGYLPDACKDCGGSGISQHNDLAHPRATDKANEK